MLPSYDWFDLLIFVTDLSAVGICPLDLLEAEVDLLDLGRKLVLA